MSISKDGAGGGQAPGQVFAIGNPIANTGGSKALDIATPGVPAIRNNGDKKLSTRRRASETFLC